jgi:hypothetical protein
MNVLRPFIEPNLQIYPLLNHQNLLSFLQGHLHVCTLPFRQWNVV